MPTYQYACADCGHELEAVQSFSDAPLTQCPACEGRLRKRFNSVGIVFKGSGFYRTDSRNGAKSADSGSTGSADKGAAAGGSSGDKAAKSDGASGGKAATATPGGSGSSSSSSSGSSSGSGSGSGSGSSSGGTANAAA